MVETLQEINMVQELAYDNCAMFPSRQGGFNMPLGFSYGPQQGAYVQDYGQFSVAEPTPLSQGGSPCAWPGMYTAGSPTGGRGSAGLEEWPNFCVTSTHMGSTGTQSPPSAYHSYRGNAYTTLPGDYNPTALHPMNTSSVSALSNTPSPTPGAGQTYPGLPGIAPNTTPRQTRPPYDWMKKQQLPVVPTTGKTRTKDKYRVVYTDHQRLELEKEFHYSRYITIRRKAELAQNLNLSERQVKIWFQNRRAKERKQNKKREDAGGVGSTPRVGTMPGVGVSPGVASPVASGAGGAMASGLGTSAKSSLIMSSPGSLQGPMSAIKTEKQLTSNNEHMHEHSFPHGPVLSPQDNQSMTPLHHHGPVVPVSAHSQQTTPVQLHAQHL